MYARATRACTCAHDRQYAHVIVRHMLQLVVIEDPFLGESKGIY